MLTTKTAVREKAKAGMKRRTRQSQQAWQMKMSHDVTPKVVVELRNPTSFEKPKQQSTRIWGDQTALQIDLNLIMYPVMVVMSIFFSCISIYLLLTCVGVDIDILYTYNIHTYIYIYCGPSWHRLKRSHTQDPFENMFITLAPWPPCIKPPSGRRFFQATKIGKAKELGQKKTKLHLEASQEVQHRPAGPQEVLFPEI